MMKNLTYIGLVVAVFIWGFTLISVDLVLDALSVSELTIVRLVAGSLILWVIQALRPTKLAIRLRDLPLIGLIGLLGTAVYPYFVSLALRHTGPDLVTIVSGGIPITTIVMAILLWGKRTKFRNILWIVLSFAGVIVMSSPSIGQASYNLRGIGLVIIANVLWALYALSNEAFNHKYDQLQLLTVQWSVGLVGMTVYYIIELSQNKHVEVINLMAIIENPSLLGHVIFICIGSVMAYTLYNYAISHIGVMITGLSINVVAVLALIIGVAVGINELDFAKVMGCLMVVVALFFIEDL